MEFNDEEKNKIFISRETTKRLINDIRDIVRDPLDNEGIYYKHDEEDMLKGYAYIVGPKDSLYQYGNYFFRFDFPTNYPHNPPKVTYMTNNGYVRFHPNLYKNGKVCLSILNTWKGDQWSGCQTIRSILLTLISILDEKPLLHEPGITELHKDFVNYHKIITYTNIEFAILTLLNEKHLKDNYKSISFYYNLFNKNIMENVKKNKSDILKLINSNKSNKEEIIKTGLYNIVCKIDYKTMNKQKNILDKF